MLSENAAAWVAALRSGLYRQGQNVLRRKAIDDGPDEYCCLGVACELAVAAGIIPPAKEDTGVMISLGEVYLYGDSYSTRLPPTVAEWLGLRDCSGEFQPLDGKRNSNTLASLNDDGVDFEAIAAVVESEPSRLFTQAQ